MSFDDRPNPDDLLQALRQEEVADTKGKLKIFLGMAAGVGKTYAMLEAAHNIQDEGVYVAIGAIETHGRTETVNLLAGLPEIPKKTMTYKGTVFEELDIDEILKQKPQLILVDELAHSNIPGSRHPKRWQDVLEILDNGIDVYTTLNVQHIESLKDIVEKITGITIRETVPDSMIEQASNIEIVDLTPNELLQRLREGKIYLGGERSKLAAENFFQEDRITALREIALRYAAEKVDRDLHGLYSTAEKAFSWKPRERLLVAISSSPQSQKLLRTTKRIAASLGAPWFALHIDDGLPLSEEESAFLSKNLSLARELGAEVIVTNDEVLSNAISRIAKQRNITQILIGRPPKKYFWSSTLIDKIAVECPDIDVHVVRQSYDEKKIKSRKSQTFVFHTPFSSYLWMTGIVALIIAAAFYIGPSVGYRAVGLSMISAILLMSLFFRRGVIIYSSFVLAFFWYYFFIPEEWTFGINNEDDLIFLILFLLTGTTTSILIERSRLSKEKLIKREESFQALYEVARYIDTLTSPRQIVDAVKIKLESLLKGKCDVILKDIDNGLVYTELQKNRYSDKEKATVEWVYENGEEAGWSTNTLPMSINFYLPLKGFNEVVGVMAFKPKTEQPITPEEKNLLYTIGQQLASHLTRLFADERRKKRELVVEKEKIYTSILDLISRQFSVPLKKIQESVERSESIPSADSLREIGEYSDRLSHVVENITTLVTLSAGITSNKKEKYSVEDLIKGAVDKIKEHKIHYKIEVQNYLPKIDCVPSLMIILLSNLILKACESVTPCVISIEAKQVQNYLIISIANEAKSIQEFETNVSTVDETSDLGLTVVKNIIDLHGGRLKIEKLAPSGARYSLILTASDE